MITLTVPLTLTRLTLEYLEGSTVVGVFTGDVPPGSDTFEVSDPDWSEVAEVETIAVAPAMAIVPEGATQKFTAVATFSDGSTQDVTTAASWSSGSSSVATVDSTGQVTAVAVGTTTVSASLNGVSFNAAVTVVAAVTDLTVSPGDSTLVSSGKARPFTATATFSDSTVADVTEQADWTSTNPAVVSVSTRPGSKGRVRTTGVGSAEVQASLFGVTAASSVTVTSDPTARFPGRVYLPGQNQAVAVGDINGDGHLDVVSVDPGLGQVQVLLGDGHGLLGSQKDYATAARSSEIAVGDLNGDGRADVVTSSEDNDRISVLLANESGGLGAHADYFMDMPTGLALADLNGDAKLDVVTTKLDVRLGNGDGTLAARQTGPANRQDYIAAGDVNQDGKIDAVVARFTDVQLWLGNGDGTFTTGPGYVSNDPVGGLVLVDLNEDGRPDLSTVSELDEHVSVQLNNGSGGFMGAQVYSTTSPGPSSVAALASLDENGDGHSDLVTSGSLFLGNGDGTFAAPVVAVLGSPSRLAIGDLDGDGASDVVGSQATVSLTRGTGHLDVARHFSAFDGARRASDIAVGDLNGDDIPDLATTIIGTSEAATFLGNGDGTFQAAQVVTTGITSARCVSLADVDENGTLDLLVASKGWSGNVSVQLGHGDGSFELPSMVPTGQTVSLATADVNGDHHLDLVTAADGQAVISLGAGDGTFGLPRGYPAGTDSHFVAVGDLNGDDDLDLVSVYPDGGGELFILLNNGDGTFAGPSSVLAPPHPWNLAIADFNDDGAEDLAIASLTGEVYVYPGNGDGSFQASTVYKFAGQADSIEVGDVNADGRLDFIAGSAGARVFLGNGDGTFIENQLFAADYFGNGVALSDLDGDGCVDIALPSTAGVEVLLQSR